MKRRLTKKKAQHLREVIEYVLGVNVTLNKSRKRNVVNARVIFSQILKEYGYGCSCISRELDKNHATVLHYFQSYQWNVSQDDELRIGYDIVKLLQFAIFFLVIWIQDGIPFNNVGDGVHQVI